MSEGPTDHLGRELDEDGDKPQTVEDFAAQRDDLTDEQRAQLGDDTGQVQQSEQGSGKDQQGA